MRPTFAGFSVAKRGLDAARANLSITGQNMANVNVDGYTRQRVDLNSIGVMGWKTRYASTSPYIGGGVAIGGTSQIRDPYLDVRYRRENCKSIDAATQLSTLKDLEYIFDEITKEGLSDQFDDLVSQLENLVGNESDPVNESIVKTSAQMLVKIFNQCSSQIQTAKNEQFETLRDGALEQANSLLKSIAHINGEIKVAHSTGNPALEHLDTRNSMIDALAGLMNIEVTTKNVPIGSGQFVEELSINMIGADGEKFNLIDNKDFHQFDLMRDAAGDYTVPVQVALYDSDGLPVGGSMKGTVQLADGNISDHLLSGEFHAHLKMLNNAGEFDDPPTKDRGIQYYEKMLNLVANKFADAMNTANSTDGTNDKPLFEAFGGGDITAANLSISSKWNNTSGSYLTTTKTDANGNPTNNILYMISLLSSDVNFTAPVTDAPLFKGNFQACFSNISVTLGLESKEISRQFSTYNGVLNDIDKQRASVSSVNNDEEGINLIQFNQALQASSRFMTTLDEAVDIIINKMGIVGR